MRKEALRKLYKEKRAQLSTDQIEDQSMAIANQLLQVDGLWNFNYYHIFLSIDHRREVNTEYILSVLQGKDKNVLISKSNFKQSTLTHYLLTDNTVIKINTYGIPEPEQGIELKAHQVEVVFIPLLAYDIQGNRIGYGKGFYDRFLADCRPEVLKIGLSFYPPEKELFSEVNQNDIPLDYCITPDKIYKF